MERKVQKNHHVIVINDDELDKSCTACGCCGSKFVTGTIFLFLLVLFISSIYLHYHLMTVSTEISNISALKFGHSIDTIAIGSSSVTDVSEEVFQGKRLVKRHNRQNRGRNSRRRRNERTDTIAATEQRSLTNERALQKYMVKPAIHLTGSIEFNPNNINDVQNHRFVAVGDSHGVFRWTHHNRPLTFGYVEDFNGNNAIIGVTIRTPGLYLIYSQVIINGNTQQGRVDPYFGLETKRIVGDVTEVLMTSHTTQDGRGSAYPQQANAPGRQVYPVDFINHMGMFPLECDDILYAKIPSQSVGGRYRSDRHQAYMGLVLINPKYSFIDRPNGC